VAGDRNPLFVLDREDGESWLDAATRVASKRGVRPSEVAKHYQDMLMDQVVEPLCGAFIGTTGTTPLVTCVRRREHAGACDNVKGDYDERQAAVDALLILDIFPGE
jgi:hypothetical protein